MDEKINQVRISRREALKLGGLFAFLLTNAGILNACASQPQPDNDIYKSIKTEALAYYQGLNLQTEQVRTLAKNVQVLYPAGYEINVSAIAAVYNYAETSLVLPVEITLPFDNLSYSARPILSGRGKGTLLFVPESAGYWQSYGNNLTNDNGANTWVNSDEFMTVIQIPDSDHFILNNSIAVETCTPTIKAITDKNSLPTIDPNNEMGIASHIALETICSSYHSAFSYHGNGISHDQYITTYNAISPYAAGKRFDVDLFHLTRSQFESLPASDIVLFKKND